MCDDARTRVLNAAGRIFAERGFQAATVRDICQSAEVNLASVNYYFGDKEKLYIETVKRARQARADQAPMPDASPGTPPEERLTAFIRTMLTRMIGIEEAPWQSQLMMREILSPTKACEEMVEEFFRPEFNLLLDILDGLLPNETPQHTRQQVGFSIIGQCLFYRVAGNIVAMLISPDMKQQHYSVDQLTEHISRIALAALGSRTPLSAGLQAERD
jgi:AcrR family transcriptional regulator